MSRPIRNITEARGFAISRHNLASFGGAGGQHACAIARILGMPRIIIHKYSSILSAYGIGLADVVAETAVPAAYVYSDDALAAVLAKFGELKSKTTEELASQGVHPGLVVHECYLSMRYEGSDTNLSVIQPLGNDFRTAFVDAHRREFAFELANRPIVVDAVRVRGIGKSRDEAAPGSSIFREPSAAGAGRLPEVSRTKKVFIDGSWLDVPVYELSHLPEKSTFTGPALVIDNTQTILAETGCKVSVLKSHVVIDMPRKEAAGSDADSAINPVELSTFASRFMSIAEQMGNTLQRTSISTSIKERLDFSCALFTPDGKLVANAPHIPVQ
ncbi:Hydantoinase/oxoprolinase [Macrophomina phaseolina MS6]|uniref:Hydantoinase/oxoprolinase n=1 Tax=Macrophomina phaseolina (strain MS6) TaxID=1126212 RepID=K2S7Q5_MACPH|nr:Hydantoinase/oxoprolinase [Macrophomina phaseolina MS6]